MGIKFEKVSHVYNLNTPMEQRAIYDINIDIQDNKFVSIIGHTGSGKSTLIQHMNGLLKPSSGVITVGKQTIKSDEKNKNLKAIRQHVGLVFQFPEYQLFEETVEKDIMFGPMNYGVSEEEARQRAKEVAKIVGLEDMNLVCEYAEHVIVMHRGEMKLQGSPKEVFKEVELLGECGITLPLAAQNYYNFASKLGLSVEDLPLTTEEFVLKIEDLVERG